jgi:hypothetical protein
MFAKMKNWAIVGAQLNPYQAPELQTKQLRGQVFGHERFEDGECVTTSTIIKREGNEIVTKNTTYWLGEVCPDYRAWCDEHGHDPYPKT